MPFKKIYRFGDRLEDKVRGRLSHYPIVYAFVGGVGIILFWRGIWHTMDFLMEYYFSISYTSTISSNQSLWWDGPLSVIIGGVLLLITGLFVSNFIGNEIIISGLRGEKKVVEKTKQEIEEDVSVSIKMMSEIKKVSQQLDEIKKELNNKK